jgi:hypothetical protein
MNYDDSFFFFVFLVLPEIVSPKEQEKKFVQERWESVIEIQTKVCKRMPVWMTQADVAVVL